MKVISSIYHFQIWMCSEFVVRESHIDAITRSKLSELDRTICVSTLANSIKKYQVGIELTDFDPIV